MITGQDIYYSTKVILIDLIRDIVYFPFWWYSAGLILVFKFYIKSLQAGSKRLAIKILFKYWFKPMYGQKDIEGKIISFLMRTFNLLWKLILMLIWFGLITFILLFYLLLPVVVVYKIFIK